MQPIVTTAVEVVVWIAIFAQSGLTTLNGFGPEYYLAYALWAVTVGRISANWMYEFMMVNDIDQGTLNSVLVRPISFYEYYLFQFLGYKLATAAFTFWLPAAICYAIGLPVHLERIPLMFLLVGFYLVFTHTLSYIVATIAFHINKSYSFTAIKNMTLWVLGGELFPLDLLPEPIRSWVVALPFSSGVYIPVGFVTGRFGYDVLLKGFVSLAVSTLILAIVGIFAWRKGLKVYSGTGA